jgi:hypothetical protein
MIYPRSPNDKGLSADLLDHLLVNAKRNETTHFRDLWCVVAGGTVTA